MSTLELLQKLRLKIQECSASPDKFKEELTQLWENYDMLHEMYLRELQATSKEEKITLDVTAPDNESLTYHENRIRVTLTGKYKVQ